MLQSCLLHSNAGTRKGVGANGILEMLEARDIGVPLMSRDRRDSAFFEADLNPWT